MLKKICTVCMLLLFNQVTYAGENTKIVEQFIEAFNQKNVDDMLELSAENLRWMSIAGQNISIEASSRNELRGAMSGYFESTPSASSVVRSINGSGSFVYTLEEAFWITNGSEKSQCSVAVYELKTGKIQNVWYFPEHRC